MQWKVSNLVRQLPPGGHMVCGVFFCSLAHSTPSSTPFSLPSFILKAGKINTCSPRHPHGSGGPVTWFWPMRQMGAVDDAGRASCSPQAALPKVQRSLLIQSRKRTSPSESPVSPGLPPSLWQETNRPLI